MGGKQEARQKLRWIFDKLTDWLILFLQDLGLKLLLCGLVFFQCIQSTFQVKVTYVDPGPETGKLHAAHLMQYYYTHFFQ